YLVDQIATIDNISVRTETQVTHVDGSDRLEQVGLETPSGKVEIAADAIFVFIGARPRTEWLDTVIARDERGFIITGAALEDADRWGQERSPMIYETSMPGVFAVGDVRALSLKRVASAVGEGAVSVHLVHNYLTL
ncbi:NAD(P)/FAD-dependent oxidoreductase, partial [Ilumatobacter sp.]|uniref:NAD(P)/FAD-dependent oxidoreductase n=1 Tax=Ilumatobacter sp. TaxID=1967498 RepID=UPI003C650132